MADVDEKLKQCDALGIKTSAEIESDKMAQEAQDDQKDSVAPDSPIIVE